MGTAGKGVKRTVNVELLNQKISEIGLAEVAKRCEDAEGGLSIHTILLVKSRTNPMVLKKEKTRKRLARAIGVEEDTLFPPVGSETAAS